MMDRGLYEPPQFPFRQPFQIKVLCLERIHFQNFLAGYFGQTFAEQVMNSPVPVVLPIVTYGQEWDLTVFILI